MEKGSALHGFILHSPDQSAFPPPELPIVDPYFRVEGPRANGWHVYAYEPERDPTFNLDRGGDHSPEPVYWLADNRSPRCLLLSSSKLICDHLVDRLLNRGRITKIRTVGLNVKRLVDLVSNEFGSGPPPVDSEECARYCITGLLARCSSAGSDLRTVILYGQDVSGSELFSRFHHTFDAYQVGLRRTDDYAEALRVANDGYISFVDRGDASLQQVERCLRMFLVEDLYVY